MTGTLCGVIRNGRTRSCRRKRAAPASRHPRVRLTLVWTCWPMLRRAPWTGGSPSPTALEAQRALLQCELATLKSLMER